MTQEPRLRYYGRRKSRPLKGERQSALETILPKIEITREKLDTGFRRYDEIFDFQPDQVWFEIGFGNGDSLAQWHRAHPSYGFIACEPFINGVANLCKLVADDDLGNIRIWNDIMQPLVRALPAASVDRIYLLNSDPWPKARHHRRRVIQADSLKELSRILKPGGILIMTTDHDTLAAWMLEHALREPTLAWTARTPEDWQTPPGDWLETRYEGKGKTAGRRQTYLIFTKVAV